MEKEQQWKLVAEKLRAVADTATTDPEPDEERLPTEAEAMARLEKYWQEMKPNPHPNVPREECSHVAEYVLPAIDCYTSLGYYPPPELMLALSVLLSEYMQGAGNLSLEEAMFGRPRRRTGTFAARNRNTGRDMLTDAITRAAAKHGQSEHEAIDLLESLSAIAFRRADGEALLRAKRRYKAKKPRTE